MNTYRNNYLNFDITLDHMKLFMLSQDFMINQIEVSYTFNNKEFKQIFDTKDYALDYIVDLLSCMTEQDIDNLNKLI